MPKLLIWGCGGHGAAVLDCAATMSAFAAIALIDDSPDAPNEFYGYRVLGDRTVLPTAVDSGYTHVVVSIGENRARATCFDIAVAFGLQPAIIAHPSAVLSPSAMVGAGTVIMPGAVLNAGSSVGKNCIINTSAIVEHGCRIGDHVHLSPGVCLGSDVIVRNYVHIGTGAAARPGATIGEGAVVGAGAVIINSIPPGVTAVGVPARPLPGR
jgi:acetyltransferase EpsM